MAKNTARLVKTAMILSFLLVLVVLAESRMTHVGGFHKAKSSLECDEVVGVKSGDSCTAISESFKLSLESFLAINPNINCNALFVGQWVCVEEETD